MISWAANQGRNQRTYCLEEKSVVVEIILDEQKVSLASLSWALNHDIQCALKKKVILWIESLQAIKPTSSSISKNVTDLASLTASKVSTPLVATFQPRRPEPSLVQATRSAAQGTEYIRWGVWSLPATVMARRSGNPSRLISPNFKAIGRGGLKVVSNTRSDELDENREDVGNLTKFWNFYMSLLSK